MHRIGIVFVFLLLPGFTLCQSAYQPLESNSYHYIDRLEIKSGKFAPRLHSSHKPYARQALTKYAKRFDTMKVAITGKDRLNLFYIYKQNDEWMNKYKVRAKKPLLKYFYRNKADLYHTKSNDFMLKVNPVIYWAGGKQAGMPELKLINTRGIKARGWINKKVGFYTSLTENQAYYPNYVQRRIKRYDAVPGQGFYKGYKAFIADPDSGKRGVDFFDARGYITFRATQHIDFQFGHDKHFIGNGHRSLFLSNYSNNYLFLKANTQVGPFEYQNLFTRMTGQHHTAANILVPTKYGAFHHLSLNVTDWLNFGFFEGVIFQRSQGFDINYINPVIFYRSVEQQLGSPDNALAGLDFKANFLKHFSLYGQLLLDEWKFNEVLNQTGWWGNKQGLQLGLKYIDVAGIDHLDVQLEYNKVRPYTYSFRDSMGEYSHYNQPLAHPLGANFQEFIGILRYRPSKRITIQAKGTWATKGEDTTGVNWGGNIFKPYTSRERSYDNAFLQGVAKQIQMVDLTLSYEPWHNLFIDLRYLHRTGESILPKWDGETNYIELALRLNIAQQTYDY